MFSVGGLNPQRNGNLRCAKTLACKSILLGETCTESLVRVLKTRIVSKTRLISSSNPVVKKGCLCYRGLSPK